MIPAEYAEIVEKATGPQAMIKGNVFL